MQVQGNTKALEYYFHTYLIFPLTCRGLELLEMVMEKLDGRIKLFQSLEIIRKTFVFPNKCR